MTKPIRRNSGLWEYLKTTGVLDRGNPKEIEAAKRQYRKRYHQEYKRNRRAKHPEVTVVMDRVTYGQLNKAAAMHHQSLATFLREASVHYVQQRYLVPDPGLVAAFAQRLRICASDINLIARHVKKLKLHELHESYMSLSERIQYLEGYVTETLQNPPRL